jgi:hypothetical protein
VTSCSVADATNVSDESDASVFRVEETYTEDGDSRFLSVPEKLSESESELLY